MDAERCLDIYELLWLKNLDVAEQTLHVPFLQHMERGDLQADRYVAFMLQDFVYLLKVTDMLKEMSDRVKEPEDLSDFLKDRYESYRSYAVETLKEFSLRGVSDIIAGPAIEKYLSDYKTIMDTEEPIYFAVALLPCSRLWLWLANQLNETTCNAYFTWKLENMQGHPEEHYRALLYKYLTTNEQKTKAQEVFRKQMKNEYNFFASSLEH